MITRQINDLEMIRAVLLEAIRPGYVLIGPAERVYIRRPDLGPDQVTAVPRYEAGLVAQLLDARHLRVGGRHMVTVEDRTGPATSVLVPGRTRGLLARWDHLTPLPYRP
jgi:hypothetical protein